MNFSGDEADYPAPNPHLSRPVLDLYLIRLVEW